MIMKKVFVVLLCFTSLQSFSRQGSLILTPEKSNFVKTSTYAEVMDFLNTISQQNNNMQLISMGRSMEGKEIPVAILSNPKIATPEEARSSGKTIVYIQGNIHAGEVEGKRSCYDADA